MVSEAQREQRRAAGRKSGASRGRRVRQVRTAIDELIAGNPVDISQAIDAKTVDEKLAAYDAMVGDPVSWPDCLSRQNVHKAIYATERERIQAEIEVGRLVTPEQLQTALLRQAEAFLQALSSLPDVAAEGQPTGQRADIRRAAKGWIARLREQVRDHL